MDQTSVLNSQVGYATDGRQVLTFTLGTEEYGVEILKVQEIKGYAAPTPIPNTPPHVKGVINLRGTIVPIIDLRRKFGMEAAEYNQFTVIVVVQVRGKITGFIVDAVSDVLNLPTADIQPTPQFDDKCDTRFISGLAKVGEKIIILLDIEKVAASGEQVAQGSMN